MKRRTLLTGMASAGLVATGGYLWLLDGSDPESLTMDRAIVLLDRMMTGTVTTHGEWRLNQILMHCAQSVEYSMTGYPLHKSDLFKNSLGKLAFSAFAKKGEMTHGLSEAIPGAPVLSQDTDVMAAYQRFRQSMVRFKQYEGELAPHFAYGPLTKAEYEKAHAMHFYNHLQEINFG
ncbi:MAG: hypothetical protein AseanaTS_03420 [Candidatus Pelagadaptatus aseana]|uniref:DUF1569 domain-containing protein n=1 Tax=Candidatus Pelagadaptatus aseana TaxID=3120508 RepID=UPI0039B248F4